MLSSSAASRGAEAEALAVGFLTRQGYRLACRNYRTPTGEVDIIAWDGEVLCFVEVRARADTCFGDPLETITRKKIRRVVRAAQQYIDHLAGPWPEMRFDAVGILLSDPPVIELLKDAFEA